MTRCCNILKKNNYSCYCDGDTSTNDMVSVMANGLAENEEIQKASTPCMDS